MKSRLFLLSLFLLMAVPLRAEKNALSDLETSLLRVQKSILEDVSLTTWAYAVKKTAREAQIDGGVIQYAQRKFPLPVTQESALTDKEQKNFNDRTRILQKLLRKNPLFVYYTLSVPRNTDLTELNKEQFRLLTGFLQQPQQIAEVKEPYKKLPVGIYKHYIVKITLQQNGNSGVFLFVDCFHKQVHLVSGRLTIENLPAADTKPNDEFIKE